MAPRWLARGGGPIISPATAEPRHATGTAPAVVPARVSRAATGLRRARAVHVTRIVSHRYDTRVGSRAARGIPGAGRFKRTRNADLAARSEPLRRLRPNRAGAAAHLARQAPRAPRCRERAAEISADGRGLLRRALT